MATDEFITSAEAQRHIAAVVGAYNISGTFNEAWMIEELESIRSLVWSGITEYAIYDNSGDLDYSVIDQAPLSLAYLRGLCVDLLRCRAYLSSKGAKVPEAIQKKCDAVEKMLAEHTIELADIPKQADTASGGSGQVYVSKNTPVFDSDTLDNW